MVRHVGREGDINFIRIDTANREKGGPLFLNVTSDMFGKRGGNGSKTIGRWVRDKVGITDRRKAQPRMATSVR
jgi:hypothetical protein